MKTELELKLTLEKEMLRVLDDSQLYLLDEAVGGMVDDWTRDSCGSSYGPTACNKDSCTVAALGAL